MKRSRDGDSAATLLPRLHYHSHEPCFMKQKNCAGGNRAERRAQGELLFGQSLPNARN